MMNDELVRRLRATHTGPRLDHGCELCMGNEGVAHEAADEIERLRAEACTADQVVRALQVSTKYLTTELAALRKRVEEARVVNTVVEYANGEKMVWLEDDCMPLDSEGKRVALVVLD